MKILLLSDTHSYIDGSIKEHCAAADEVWHAGDIGSMQIVEEIRSVSLLRAVWGNIDGRDIRSEFPENNRFHAEGMDVLIRHIGGYPGSYTPELRKILNTNAPQLLICGHSHILKIMPDKIFNLLFMNPGAAGRSGFHKMRTMLRFEINNGKIERPEVIELGLRASLK